MTFSLYSSPTLYFTLSVPCFVCFLLFTVCTMLLHLIPFLLTHTLHFSVSVILTLSSIPSLHPVSDHTHHYLLSSSFDQSWPTGAVNCVPWRPATAASPFCVLSQPRLHPSSFSVLFLPRNSSSCPSLSAKQNWLCLGAHHSSPPHPVTSTAWLVSEK